MSFSSKPGMPKDHHLLAQNLIHQKLIYLQVMDKSLWDVIMIYVTQVVQRHGRVDRNMQTKPKA